MTFGVHILEHHVMFPTRPNRRTQGVSRDLCIHGEADDAEGTFACPGLQAILRLSPVGDPDVTFNSNITFTSHHGIVLSGTVSGDSATTVEIFDASGTTDLGTATVSDGTWTFAEKLIPDRQFHGFTAVASDDNNTACVLSNASVIGGLTGRPYRTVVDTFDENTGRLAIQFRADDGSLEYHGKFQADPSSGGSIFVETGTAAHTQFVFNDTTVSQIITNFHATGAAHDVLLLPHADFANMADLIRNTTMSHGSAVIADPNSGTSITLTGATKAELKSHPLDFSLHGSGSFLPD